MSRNPEFRYSTSTRASAPGRLARRASSPFGFRFSDFLRISPFRISNFALTLLALVSFAARSQAAEPAVQELHSPDGRVTVTFQLGSQGEPAYAVRYRNAVVLEASRLGFRVKDGAPLTNGFHVVKAERASRDERWRPFCGERAEIRDHFNALTVQLADDQAPPREMRVEFRAYDEGVALRYEFSGQSAAALTLADECTEFRFPENYYCWPVYSAQGVYARRRLSEVRPDCERPLTVDLDNGRWASVGEAALVDFARMRLQPSGLTNGIRAHLAGPATLALPGATPWRFILLADSPGGLLERNFLLANLNAPSALKDTSWIQPGTVIRDISLTTDGAKACVDFAARMGIRYVEFDAGWYGHEYSDEADARAVNLDPKRSKGPFDLHDIIRYASQRGVGVILYVNQRAMEKQLDEFLPLYEQWGVKGVKYGFVNVGSQRWTAWLHDAVRKAAEHHLVVDIHDEYRPTGLSRTWPNLLTQEGVRGNEEMPPAEHNLILPFTRFLAGPADYTYCWNDPRQKNTRTHQLAASVAFFSPLQFLFWYDRPAQITNEPALEFWRNLPTTWDDTRVIEGAPGEFLTVAREKAGVWYLGSMNGVRARQVDVDLAFLDEGRVYDALICTDAASADGGPARVQVERRQVRRGDRLRGLAFANGGLAVRLTEHGGRAMAGVSSANPAPR
jgi:alpha-glucosidase